MGRRPSSPRSDSRPRNRWRSQQPATARITTYDVRTHGRGVTDTNWHGTKVASLIIRAGSSSGVGVIDVASAVALAQSMR